MTSLLLGAALLPQAHPGGARSACFRQDGRTVTTVGDDGMVRTWRLADGHLVKSVRATSNGHLTAVSQSPDGRLIVTAGYDGKIRLWDADLKRIRSWSGGTSYVSGAAFSFDGTKVYSCGYDNRAKEWSLRGKLLRTYTGLPSDAYGLAVSRDGRHVAAVGPSGGFVVWQARTGKVVLKGSERSADFCAAAFDPTSSRVAIVALGGRLEVWDVAAKSRVSSVDTGPNGLIGVAWKSPSEIVAASYRREVYLVQAASGEVKRRIEAAPEGTFLMGLSTDHQGLRAATCDSAGDVKIWNTSDGTLDFTAGHAR